MDDLPEDNEDQPEKRAAVPPRQVGDAASGPEERTIRATQSVAEQIRNMQRSLDPEYMKAIQNTVVETAKLKQDILRAVNPASNSSVVRTLEQIRRIRESFLHSLDPASNSPVSRTLEQARQLQESFHRSLSPASNSPLSQAFEQARQLHESFQRALNPSSNSPVSQVLEQLRQHHESYKSFLTEVNVKSIRSGDFIVGIADAFARLNDPANMLQRDAGAAAVQYNQITQEITAFRERFFLVDALATIEKAQPTPQDFEAGAVADQIIEAIGNRFAEAKSQPERIWLLQVLLPIILMLIPLCYTIWKDQQDATAHEAEVRSMERSFDQLARKFDALASAMEMRPNQSPNRVLIPQVLVIQPANLRKSPTTAGKILAKLYPGQVAELLETKGGWLRVRVYDALKGLTREGWVYGKRTRKP